MCEGPTFYTAFGHRRALRPRFILQTIYHSQDLSLCEESETEKTCLCFFKFEFVYAFNLYNNSK